MAEILEHLPLLLVALPLIGAFLVAGLAWRGATRIARQVAVSNSVATLLLALVMAACFQPVIPPLGHAATPQMHTAALWLAGIPQATGENQPAFIPGLDVRLSLAVDGLSLWPLVGTALIVCAVLASPRPAAMERTAGFEGLVLLLQAGAMILFAAQDIVLFAIGLQWVLVTFFLLLGWWGGPDRRAVATRFATYQLTGGALVLLGLAGLVIAVSWIRAELDPSRTALLFDISTLTTDGYRLSTYSEDTARHWMAVAPLLCWLLILGFAVLMPVFPLHLWWTSLASEAAAPVAALAAGILLKVGLYGWLRFVLPLFPMECPAWTPWLTGLAYLGAAYFSLLALAQNDLRRFAGCATAALLQLAVAGCWSLTAAGVQGSLLLGLALGCGPAAVFLLVGTLEERYQTRDPEAFGGLATLYPRLGCWLGAVLLSLTGLPWLGGWSAFVLIISAIATTAGPLSVVLPSMLILSWAAIWILQRTLFGRSREPLQEFQFAASWSTLSGRSGGAWSGFSLPSSDQTLTTGRLPDLELREVAPIGLLLAASLWLSLGPQVFVNSFQSGLTLALAHFDPKANGQELPVEEATAGDAP